MLIFPMPERGARRKRADIADFQPHRLYFAPARYAALLLRHILYALLPIETMLITLIDLSLL